MCVLLDTFIDLLERFVIHPNASDDLSSHFLTFSMRHVLSEQYDYRVVVLPISKRIHRQPRKRSHIHCTCSCHVSYGRSYSIECPQFNVRFRLKLFE
jgi:hypothetical protein